MNNKTKLRIFIIFMLIVVGGGFLFALLIPKNAIKKSGYKTKHNPNYIDDKIREKKEAAKKK